MQAQLQFFSYVEDGSTTKDVKPLFSAHYDTVNAGPKLEKASYEKICREMGYQPEKMTFLTDNVKGMLALLIWSMRNRFVICRSSSALHPTFVNGQRISRVPYQSITSI